VARRVRSCSRQSSGEHTRKGKDKNHLEGGKRGGKKNRRTNAQGGWGGGGGVVRTVAGGSKNLKFAREGSKKTLLREYS